ncbi:MAG: hypothetical protein ACJAZW_000337, partial [Maritalea sp.]
MENREFLGLVLDHPFQQGHFLREPIVFGHQLLNLAHRMQNRCVIAITKAAANFWQGP